MSLPEPIPAQRAPEGPRMRRAELIISAVLRIGVVSSMVVILAGTLLSFLHHRDYVTSPAELQRLTQPGAAVPQTLHDVEKGVAQLRGRSVVAAGLLLLILTPVIRVAASILAFVIQRDRTYVLITSLVLLLLLLSFSLGRAIGG
jgi:uncharacterized membrane protein